MPSDDTPSYDGEADPERVIDSLIVAIQGSRVVRLVYRRKRDDVVAIHEVAPLDMRPGFSSRTADVPYLWAWCLVEEKAETHLLDRIERVLPLDRYFDPAAVLAKWPEAAWPLPGEWLVPREW